MTREQAIAILAIHNTWRRGLPPYENGGEDLPYTMRELGKAIDFAVEAMQSTHTEIKHHCKDCCCARSWEALGISEYTGKSIPEHIAALRGNTPTHTEAELVEIVAESQRGLISDNCPTWCKEGDSCAACQLADIRAQAAVKDLKDAGALRVKT